MPKIIVWKCPHTSQLFEDEIEYQRHLKRLSRERIAARKWQELRDGISDVIAGIQQANNVQEIVDYVIKHQREFMIQGVFNDHGYKAELMHKALDNGWDIYFPKLTSLKFVTNWRTEVSNSHNCPRDGYTNWGGRNKKANGVRSYPGWYGKVQSSYDINDRHIKVKKKGEKNWKTIEAPSISEMTASFGSDNSLSGICTGSGGGVGKSCQYEVSLFQSDFPNMAKQATVAILVAQDQAATWGSGLRHYSTLDEIGHGEFKLHEKV